MKMPTLFLLFLTTIGYSQAGHPDSLDISLIYANVVNPAISFSDDGFKRNQVFYTDAPKKKKHTHTHTHT